MNKSYENKIQVNDLINYEPQEGHRFTYLARSTIRPDVSFITLFIQLLGKVGSREKRIGITITARRNEDGSYQWHRPEVEVPAMMLRSEWCFDACSLIETAAETADRLQERFNGTMADEDYTLIKQIST